MSEVQAVAHRRGPRLRYQRVHDQIEQDILAGKYPTGHKLPSLGDLSRTLRLNHVTIRRGLDELAAKGLVEIVPRVGTFVTNQFPPVRMAAVPRIVLGMRSYMLKQSEQHPAVASYLIGLEHKQRQGELVAQVMFYQKGEVAQQLGSRLLSEKINGFILADGGNEADYEFFRSNQIHVVDCGGSKPANAWVCTVIRDRASVVRQAVDHLYELGHRRIAMLAWSVGPDRALCDQVFKQLYFDRRLGDSRGLIVRIEDPGRNPSWEQVESFFDISPLPSAVLVDDEFLADVLLSACDRRGIRVPEDLSVVALVDHTPFGHRLPLTAPNSLPANQETIERAIDMIDDLVKGIPGRTRHEIVKLDLVKKASTGPCRRP